jgi:protein SCO1/2
MFGASACAGSTAGPAATDAGANGASATSPSASASADSLGHELAAPPIDPKVSLPAYGFYGKWLSPPIRAPRFVLTDQHGRPFDFRKDTARADVTLLYFGYTNCPDLCPSELGLLATALRNVPPEIAERVKVVFVSVDPARDTVERLATYMPLFDEDFVGLTGDQAEIRRIQRAVGVTPATKIPLGGGEYSMRHDAEVLAFTKDGRAHLEYPFGTLLISWEHDLWKLVEEGWKEP